MLTEYSSAGKGFDFHNASVKGSLTHYSSGFSVLFFSAPKLSGHPFHVLMYCQFCSMLLCPLNLLVFLF